MELHGNNNRQTLQSEQSLKRNETFETVVLYELYSNDIIEECATLLLCSHFKKYTDDNGIEMWYARELVKHGITE